MRFSFFGKFLKLTIDKSKKICYNIIVKLSRKLLKKIKRRIIMSENSNDFKKGTSNFRLVGKIKLTPNTFSIGKQSDSGFISNKMYIGVDCGGGNIVYSQLFDGYKKNDDGAITKKLFVHGSKADPNNPRRSIDDFDNKIEILWADRHSPSSRAGGSPHRAFCRPVPARPRFRKRCS